MDVTTLTDSAALPLVMLAAALDVAADGHGVDEEVVDEGARDLAVHVVDHVEDELTPVVARRLEVAHDHVEEAQLGVVDLVAGTHELVDHGLDLGQVAVEVVVEHVECLVDGNRDGLRLDVLEHGGHRTLLLEMGQSPSRLAWQSSNQRLLESESNNTYEALLCCRELSLHLEKGTGWFGMFFSPARQTGTRGSTLSRQMHRTLQLSGKTQLTRVGLEQEPVPFYM